MPTAAQIELVKHYLPTDGKLSEDDGGYGWTDEHIETLWDSMGFVGPAYAVRFFWYQRTQESAEYLDAGKPLTQIHRQAKEMLVYWDEILKADPTGDSMEAIENPKGKHRLSFGEIERPWDRQECR